MTPERHSCGQWLGIRPHRCPYPANALECSRGHLKAKEWSDTPKGGRCRACDRNRAKVHYMGTHCVKGHLKTMTTWRWSGIQFYCVTCRKTQQQRWEAARRRQGSRGRWYDDGGSVPISAAADTSS